MKLPNWFKIAWWLLLLALTFFTLTKRFAAIIAGHAVVFDVFVFLVFVALMLVPLFQEVSFFGITLKQSLEELKQQVNAIRAEIHNKVNVSPTFNLPPANDQEIKESLKVFSAQLNTFLKSHGKPQDPDISQFLQVPFDPQLLFATRYSIEVELRRIWQASFGKTEQRRSQGTHKLIMDLWRVEVLPQELFQPLQQIINICNYGIHGEAVNESQVELVKNIGPKLVSSLQEIRPGSSVGTNNERVLRPLQVERA